MLGSCHGDARLESRASPWIDDVGESAPVPLRYDERDFAVAVISRVNRASCRAAYVSPLRASAPRGMTLSSPHRCRHEGLHSGQARYHREVARLRYVIVCDACLTEVR